MEYTEIANVADEIIASLLTLIFVFIYNKYIKVIWRAKNTKDAKIKARILFFARYLAIVITISLLWIFFPLSKLFVFIMSVIFSFLIIMVIYDYTSFSLNSMLSDQEKEKEKLKCKRLITTLINTEKSNKDKRQQLIDSLKKLDCNFGWSDLEA